MFTKTKEPEPVAAPQPQQSAAMPKRPQRANVPSIISADLAVTGTVVSSGDVQIDGRIDGDVRVGALVVGETAEIKGDVYADDVVIRGHVSGGIRARKVHLAATARVEGNILHQTLGVEAGAFFEGNCRHSENPLGDAADAQASRRLAAKPANGGTAKAEEAPAAPRAPAGTNLFTG